MAHAAITSGPMAMGWVATVLIVAIRSILKRRARSSNTSASMRNVSMGGSELLDQFELADEVADEVSVSFLANRMASGVSGFSFIQRPNSEVFKANMYGSSTIVQVGLEVLMAEDCKPLQGHKVGLLTNPTGINNKLEHAVDLLHQHRKVHLAAVFGPEHGFRGVAQDGASEKGYTKDHRTGVAVYDLYGVRGKKLMAMLESSGIDCLVFDIQDVGARFYTYIWLLYDCMVASAKLGVKVVVLDRPNPVGGNMVEGPLLKSGFESDVGRKAITLRHGMTVGELALLFNSEHVAEHSKSPCQLHVVCMKGWYRNMAYRDTGLPWVPPSPNMPTADTALVYSGMGLFEGTNCSEGRGTTLPFQLIGAPWIDHRLAIAAQAAVKQGLVQGAAFREAYFCPQFGKHAGITLCGVQVHITDQGMFEPVRAAVVLMVSMKKLYGSEFKWRPCSVGTKHFIDLLVGSSTLREAIDNNRSVDEILAIWQHDLIWFKTLRAQFFLYSE